MSESEITEEVIRRRLAHFNLSEEAMRTQVANVLNGVCTLDDLERSWEALAFENATRRRRQRLAEERRQTIHMTTEAGNPFDRLNHDGGKTNAVQRLLDPVVVPRVVVGLTILAAIVVGSLQADRNGFLARAGLAVAPAAILAGRSLMFFPRTRRLLSRTDAAFRIGWQEIVRAAALAVWAALPFLDPDVMHGDLTGPDTMYGVFVFVGGELLVRVHERRRSSAGQVTS